MLIFLIVGGLFKLVASQPLYESSLVKNTILHDGMLSDRHFLLENCDKLLQDEREKYIKTARNVNKLTKKLEISNISLMTLQPLINLTGKIFLQFCSYTKCIFKDKEKYSKQNSQLSMHVIKSSI